MLRLAVRYGVQCMCMLVDPHVEVKDRESVRREAEAEPRQCPPKPHQSRIRAHQSRIRACQSPLKLQWSLSLLYHTSSSSEPLFPS